MVAERARDAGNPTSWVTRGGGTFAPGEENDGTLAVEETRLPELAAFAKVAASHTWIMDDEAARAEVVRLLYSA